MYLLSSMLFTSNLYLAIILPIWPTLEHHLTHTTNSERLRVPEAPDKREQNGREVVINKQKLTKSPKVNGFKQSGQSLEH